MLKKDFLKAYNPLVRCKVFYKDGFNNTQVGIAMDNVQSKKRGKPYVLVDSMVNKIDLTRIFKVEPTEVKW